MSAGDLAIVILISLFQFYLQRLLCHLKLLPQRDPFSSSRGGAVKPATKPTIGFFVFSFFKNSAASSSAEPPISIIIMDSVSLSFKNNSKQSIKFVPLIDLLQFLYKLTVPCHLQWFVQLLHKLVFQILNYSLHYLSCITRHNSYFTFVWSNYSRTIRSY